MTKEEKKLMRNVRAEVKAKALKFATHRFGMFATQKQLNAYAKTLTARFLKSTRKVPTTVHPI